MMSQAYRPLRMRRPGQASTITRIQSVWQHRPLHQEVQICNVKLRSLTKYTWGACHNTELAGHLQESGVTQVVVCGLPTAIGVGSAARQAHEHGFHVTLPIDAMTDLAALRTTTRSR